MNRVIKLYTKTGDGGESGLANGMRLSKDEMVFEVLGTLDELNAALGMVVAEARKASQLPDLAEELMKIQDRLLVVGAVVAGSDKVRLTNEEVEWLEKRIDDYQLQTREDWYKHFLLPGGVELAARIDVARSLCRRLERRWITYRESAQIKPKNMEMMGKYLNRLSDHLFAMRCYVNSQAGYVEREFNVV